MEQNELPVGLAMALAMNPEAMAKFAVMSEDEKQAIVNETHKIGSREEMHRFVEKIVAGK